RFPKTAFLAPFVLAPASAFAQAAASKADSGDTAWMLTATMLVLLMTIPGLALFYGGMVRAKNLLSVLMQCFAITALVTVAWFVYGYSLAFDTTGMQAGVTNIHAFIGGFGHAMLSGVTPTSLYQTVPESVFVMFQMTFAIITPALIIGAYVERIRFDAVLLISGLWLLIVYVPVAHWVWGGGWLAKRGVIDFAGGIVVHVTAGVSALVVAWMLKPRADFPKSIRPPHAPWMVMVGASLLWVGWFGFNAGSALASNADAGMAMLTTHLSAATATLVWMAIEWVSFGKPSLVGAVTGTIAGLATITPAAGSVGPLGAVLLGAAASIVCYMAVHFVKRILVVDDALDVLGVHGVGGALGTLTLPFLAGIGVGGSALHHTIGAQFVVQLEGVAVTIVWSAIATFLITKFAGLVVGLRVDREHEIQGLDFATHGESAYHGNR
ncbi:MAG TPA: ammonium transporter, partial [Rhizomicrobium sp.]|nr:ammonium transporter [Rhizomicrobium sp.]